MAMRDSGGKVIGLVNILRDETEARQARESLAAALQEKERARAEAEQANAAKDRFLAVLSHELRTPLTPVQLSLSVLESESERSSNSEEALKLIRRNVETEIRLIDDLLDVNRIVHGKLDFDRLPLDLHDCLRRALAISETDFSAKNLRVTTSLDATRHRLAGDAMRVQQIFGNLIQNAAKFTPVGGAITVLSRDLESGGMLVDVADTGIGIEPEAMARIFDPFEQGNPDLARRYGGLGLGLAISRNLVLAHGGRLTATSEGTGRGSTFTVEFPGTTEQEASGRPGQPEKVESGN